MTTYELMVIAKPKMLENDYKKLQAMVKDMIDDQKGTLVYDDIWGKRSLAYKIDKHDDGYYMLFYFQLDPSLLKALDEELKLEQNVLRHMLLKLPKQFDIAAYIEDEKAKTKEIKEKVKEKKGDTKPELPSANAKKPAVKAAEEKKEPVKAVAPKKEKPAKEEPKTAAPKKKSAKSEVDEQFDTKLDKIFEELES